MKGIVFALKDKDSKNIYKVIELENFLLSVIITNSISQE